MNIIIAGVGKAGNAVMRQLLADGHTVTVIDSSKSVLDRISDGYDIMKTEGNCLMPETLGTAGIDQANLLISLTGSDEINLLCCLSARKLNPDVHTIPRVRNPEYLRLSADLREEFGISMLVNPDRDAAQEIYKLLQFPEFLKRETFAKGRIEIVQLKVGSSSKLCGASIYTLSQLTGCKVLVCAIVRGGKAIIPKGEVVLCEDDNVYVTASNSELARLLRNLGMAKRKVKNIMIIGGDRIAVYLAKSLAENGVRIKIIENDPERCRILAETVPSATVICGDGASQDVLDREGCGEMDALITLTGLDEVNMIVSMYAASSGVGKVVTKLGRIESPALLGGLNIGSVVSATHLSSSSIARYARAMSGKSGSALTVHQIVEGQVEAMEFPLDESAKYTGVPLRDVPVKKEMLLACIIHKGMSQIPNGDSVFVAGDTVIVVAPTEEEVLEFNDIFE